MLARDLALHPLAHRRNAPLAKIGFQRPGKALIGRAFTYAVRSWGRRGFIAAVKASRKLAGNGQAPSTRAQFASRAPVCAAAIAQRACRDARRLIVPSARTMRWSAEFHRDCPQCASIEFSRLLRARAARRRGICRRTFTQFASTGKLACIASKSTSSPATSARHRCAACRVQTRRLFLPLRENSRWRDHVRWALVETGGWPVGACA